MGFTRTPLFWIIFSLFALVVLETLVGVFFSLRFQLPLQSVTPWLPGQYYFYYGHLPEVRQVLWVGHALSLCVLGFLTFMLFKPQAKKLYGEVRLATLRDLRRATPCLLGQQGIVLGKFRGRYIVQEGQQSVGLCAPTRTGKGASVVVPNLLSWNDSVVVTDIKEENYRLTAGFRQRCGQKVYFFNPLATDRCTHCWNPLTYISDDVHFRIDDIQKIAQHVLPTPAGDSPIWSTGGRELFVGIVLYLLDVEGLPVTIGEVYRQLRTEQPSAEHFQALMERHRCSLDPHCVRVLSNFCHLPDKQREGVKDTLATAISLWSNPILDAATAKNDFDFRHLRRQRMSIYVGISPDNLLRMSPILRLFFQQLVDVNTRKLPEKKGEPYSVLLAMDEFPAMGPLESIIKSVAFIAGYNLRLLTIAQSQQQMADPHLYGPAKTENFFLNHASLSYFPPKTLKEARLVSEELGTTTTLSASTSDPKGFGRGWGTRTRSETQRPFMLPQEIKALGQQRTIIISENCPPIIADKIVYFKDPVFRDRCVPKTHRRRARQSKTQEDFMQCVHAPPSVPPVTLTTHGVRAMAPTPVVKVESLFPNPRRAMSEAEIEAACSRYYAAPSY